MEIQWLRVGTKMGTVAKLAISRIFRNRRKRMKGKELLEPPAGIEPATC